MSTTQAPLRILSRNAIPLRLGDLLWDGQIPISLDVVDQPLYRSAMNHVEQPDAARALESPHPQADGTLFTFLAVAERLYERIAETLARVGLSYAKYEVLRHLRDAKGPVSLGSLADAQSCARSNITQLVDRLEKEGLVRRVDDPADRRGVRAELTPLGVTQADEGATQIDLVRAWFAASFSATERAELGRLLGKVQ